MIRVKNSKSYNWWSAKIEIWIPLLTIALALTELWEKTSLCRQIQKKITGDLRTCYIECACTVFCLMRLSFLPNLSKHPQSLPSKPFLTSVHFYSNMNQCSLVQPLVSMWSICTKRKFVFPFGQHNFDYPNRIMYNIL